MTPEVYPVSECCIEYRFGKTIARETSDRVLQLFRYLTEHFDSAAYGVRDIVPTYTTVAVHYAPESTLMHDLAPLHQAVRRALASDEVFKGQHHIIEVDYRGEDVEEVCKALGITAERLVTLHCRRTYRIAMLGFRPFFPYLLGLDERLELPRRENPRKKVPKGAVAIAGLQTGVYPEVSPGGWHIIGHTDFEGYPSLRPGDTIEFRSVAC